MMIGAILHKLNTDAELGRLLRRTSSDMRIYPHSSEDFGPCITYSVTPQLGGEIKQDSIELRVIYPPEKEAEGRAIVKRLYQLLDFTEKHSVGWYHNDINLMSSELMGGGTTDFDSFIQHTLIFVIKWRFL